MKTNECIKEDILAMRKLVSIFLPELAKIFTGLSKKNARKKTVNSIANKANMTFQIKKIRYCLTRRKCYNSDNIFSRYT